MLSNLAQILEFTSLSEADFQRLESIFDALPVGVWVVNPEGSYGICQPVVV